MFSFELSEEQRMVKDTISDFAQELMEPVMRECDEQGSVSSDVIKQGWGLEIIPSMLPEEYGGFGEGPSAVTGAIAAEELAYGDLSINPIQATLGQVVDISLRVTNTGEVQGDEVVQLYVCDEFATVPRPVKELKAYVRISLGPGESREVIFHLPVDQLAFYDRDLNLVLEPGRIMLMIGSSSEDIRLTGEFEITGEAQMMVDERVFECPVEVR